MSVPVVFTRVARREFDDASDWYDQQQVGLGATFTRAVQDVLDEIAADPRRYAKEYLEVRGGQVAGFPYYVYYRDEGTRAVVISVFHTSRDPSVWQSRA
jgi:plasmid stabilization system protein ParE